MAHDSRAPAEKGSTTGLIGFQPASERSEPGLTTVTSPRTSEPSPRTTLPPMQTTFSWTMAVGARRTSPPMQTTSRSTTPPTIASPPTA